MDTNDILNSQTFETDWEKEKFTRWLFAIAETFKDSDIKAALTDTGSLCKMFYPKKNSGVNRQQHYHIKNNIRALQAYYGITAPIPTREEVLEAQEIGVLFKDIDSLFKFINKVGGQNLENYNDKTDLLNIKSIVILGWRGIKQEEATLIQKKDICQEVSKYYIVTARGKFEITKEDYEILTRFSALSEYRGFPTGRRVVLKGNEDLLFRGAKSEENKPGNSLTKALEKFNKTASNMGSAIMFRYLRKNALFAEIYEDLKNIKTPVNLAECIQKKFNCEAKAALSYKTEYNLWAAKFH